MEIPYQEPHQPIEVLKKRFTKNLELGFTYDDQDKVALGEALDRAWSYIQAADESHREVELRRQASDLLPLLSDLAQKLMRVPHQILEEERDDRDIRSALSLLVWGTGTGDRMELGRFIAALHEDPESFLSLIGLQKQVRQTRIFLKSNHPSHYYFIACYLLLLEKETGNLEMLRQAYEYSAYGAHLARQMHNPLLNRESTRPEDLESRKLVLTSLLQQYYMTCRLEELRPESESQTRSLWAIYDDLDRYVRIVHGKKAPEEKSSLMFKKKLISLQNSLQQRFKGLEIFASIDLSPVSKEEPLEVQKLLDAIKSWLYICDTKGLKAKHDEYVQAANAIYQVICSLTDTLMAEAEDLDGEHLAA